jgi:hypothetical protein
MERHRIARGLVCLLLMVSPFSYSQSNTKKKVTSQADLPRFSYPVTGSASALVQADAAAFNAFAAKVRADLDSVFRDYEIADKSTLRTLLFARLNLQELAGENEAGLETIESLRALTEKPSAKLTTGLSTGARLQAAIDVQSHHGPAYIQAFVKHYREAIDPLPWEVVQDAMKQAYTAGRLYTKALAVGSVETELDPAVQKSGALDNLEAWDLIATRNDLQSAIPERSSKTVHRSSQRRSTRYLGRARSHAHERSESGSGAGGDLGLRRRRFTLSRSTIHRHEADLQRHARHCCG